VKVRKCPVCGATIIKDDEKKEIKIRQLFGKPFCKDCLAVIRGEDEEKYWTEVK